MYLRQYINNFKNVLNARKKNTKIIITIIFIILLFLSFQSYEEQYNEFNQYKQDDLTIVSAYYKIKSKRKPSQYKDRLHNFVLLNKSIVFFTNKKFMPYIKAMRPKNLYNKTVFIETEIEEFYSYKQFKHEFEKSFEIDLEKRYHTVPLYMIWAEKCNFLKKAVMANYFNSKCFYWIDAGYFPKKNEIHKYSNNWPSTRKCFEDERLLIGQVSNFSDSEKNNILIFDNKAHMRLQKNHNVIGGIFGGQPKNILKFISLYYQNSVFLFAIKAISYLRRHT